MADMFFDDKFLPDLEEKVEALMDDYYRNQLIAYKIGEIDGIDVVVVNGKYISRTQDDGMNFVDASNDMSDTYVPDKTIYLDIDISSSDYPGLIVHEYTERFLRDKFGVNYEAAHKRANDMQYKFEFGDDD